MFDYAVIFLHHNTDPVTVQNYRSLVACNPDVPVVPIWSDDGQGHRDHLPNAVEVPCVSERASNWENADLIYRDYFRSAGAIQAARYIFAEWDCYSIEISFREQYRSVWDSDLAAANVRKWPRDRETFPFFESQGPYLPWHWREHLCALAPLNGVMVSHRAMTALAADPVREGLFCELRIGTQLKSLGYTPVELPREVADKNVWDQPTISGPGIYHPVKEFVGRRPTKPGVIAPATVPITWDRGPELWEQIHSESSPTPEWFKEILATLPTGGCRCQQHALEYVKANPPDFSTADRFFNWSVRFHNVVNLKLGKNVLSDEAAKKRWDRE